MYPRPERVKEFFFVKKHVKNIPINFKWVYPCVLSPTPSNYIKEYFTPILLGLEYPLDRLENEHSIFSNKRLLDSFPVKVFHGKTSR